MKYNSWILWLGALVALVVGVLVKLLAASTTAAILTQAYIGYLALSLWASQSYIGPRVLRPLLPWCEISVEDVRQYAVAKARGEHISPYFEGRYRHAVRYIAVYTIVMGIGFVLLALTPLIIWFVVT